MCVIDRLTKEITSTFEQVRTLSTKHDFLTPSNLLNENFDCQLDASENVSKANFLVERKRAFCESCRFGRATWRSTTTVPIHPWIQSAGFLTESTCSCASLHLSDPSHKRGELWTLLFKVEIDQELCLLFDEPNATFRSRHFVNWKRTTCNNRNRFQLRHIWLEKV